MLHHVGSNMIKIRVKMESCNISGHRVWFNRCDKYGTGSIFNHTVYIICTAFFKTHPNPSYAYEYVHIFKKDQ